MISKRLFEPLSEILVMFAFENYIIMSVDSKSNDGGRNATAAFPALASFNHGSAVESMKALLPDSAVGHRSYVLDEEV